MTTEIEQAIIDNASQPKKVTGDAGSVENHNLKDQIEAAKFEAAKKAGKAASFGIKMLKIQPGGTV